MPTFTPPTVRIQIVDNGLRYGMDVGVSVLRTNGVWWMQQIPSSEQVAAADRYYAGGRIYTITDAEAAELTGAGFSLDGTITPGSDVDRFVDTFTDSFSAPTTNGPLPSGPPPGTFQTDFASSF